MSASYLELKRLLKEVSSTIRGSRIINLYHMDDDSIILKLRSENFSGELRIVPGRFFYLVEGSYEKPTKLSERGRALRRLVSGSRIRDLRLVEGERIMVMELEKSGKTFKLISEFLPKGTLMVVDEDGRIIESLHHLRMRDRVIAPGEVYRLPPPRPSITETSLEDIFKTLDPNRKIVSELASKAGLGGRYAEEILYLAGVDKGVKVKDLDEEQKARILEAFKKVLHLIEVGRPTVAQLPGEAPQPLPYRMEIFKSRGYSFKDVDDLNQAFRESYEHELALRVEEERRREIEDKIQELKEKLDEKRFTANRLITRSKRLRELAQKLFKLHSRLEEVKGIDGVHEIDGLEVEVSSRRREMKISIDEETLTLKTDESLMKQISSLFNDAKKSMEAAERLLREADEIESKIDKLRRRETEEIEEVLLKVSARIRPSPRRWYERYRWFITSEGFLAVAGKDASSNISLLKKHLEPNDLIFHAEVRGAAAVILKDGLRAGERSRVEAAQFAATYSRAWRERMSQITVYYVKADQISFKPPPGHYLPRGGFIVKGERNYMTVRLELAIGLTKDLELIYGPSQALAGRAVRLVKIVPGRRKSAELAEEAAKILTENMRFDKRSLNLLKERIMELIPYGSGELVKD